MSGSNELEIQPTKGYNGGNEDLGKEGWFKISEDRFKDGRMNRKSASDMLEKLVEAANVRFTFLPFVCVSPIYHGQCVRIWN